jgi:hypothetical protein
MILKLTDVPKQWHGDALGVDDRPSGDGKPRDLRSFVLQALSEAQFGDPLPGQPGRRETEPPEVLLKPSSTPRSFSSSRPA